MARQWYYTRQWQQFGPVSSSRLKQLAACGQLEPTDHIWLAGMGNWKPAGKVKGLFPPHPPSDPASLLSRPGGAPGETPPPAPQNDGVRFDFVEVAPARGAAASPKMGNRRKKKAIPIGLIVGGIVMGLGILLGAFVFLALR